MVGLLVVLVYIRTLSAPFIWDDRHLVLESPQMDEREPLSRLFVQPFWMDDASGAQRAYYRPLTTLSLAVDGRLHGTNPGGFHLTNVVVHALNTALLCLLLLRFRVTGWAAAGLSLAFGLHPRLTEGAAWIAGRTDVLATCCVLLALLIHRRNSLARSIAAAVLIFLGLLAKEVALAGAVALAAFELFGERGGTRRLRDHLPRLVPLLATVVAYLALRTRILSGVEDPWVRQLTWMERAVAALGAIGSYAWMLALPWRPRVQIGNLQHVDARFAGLGALVLIGCAAYAIIRLRMPSRAPSEHEDGSRALTCIGVALAASGFALVLHLVPISVNVVAADRFLYLPLVGFLLLIAPRLEGWLTTRARKLVAAAVLASLAVATSLRIDDWCSEIRLWSREYAATPESNGLPGNELGNVYYRAGLYEQALAIYRRTADAAQDSGVMARANQANALSQLGQYTEARSIILGIHRTYPQFAKFSLDAALADVRELALDRAEVLAREALARAPTYKAASDVLELLPKLAALLASPELRSDDPLRKAAAQFRLHVLAGRRVDALRLGELLLGTREAPSAVRRDAAEYWVRFGPPNQLGRLLAPDGPAGDVRDPVLVQAMNSRVADAAELLATWPALGIDSR